MQAALYCPRCKLRKLENEFPRGSGSYCIECKREWNREREKTRQRDWTEQNKARWDRYRNRVEVNFNDWLDDVQLTEGDLIDWFLDRPKVRIVSLVKFIRNRYGSRVPLSSYSAEIQAGLDRQ